MFNNLIESSSHAKEFKRRGSFLLFTTATYVVLLAIGGVASIYAYDAHLEAQTTELEITFVPLSAEQPKPAPIRNTIRQTSSSEAPPGRSTRTELIDSTSNPTNVPDKIGIVASNVPPARSDSVIGLTNADPPTPAGNNRVGTGGTGGAPVDVGIPDEPPPPAEPKREPPRVVKMSTGVLRGNAISLPQPNYPAIAKQIKLEGSVSVQILIDESGRVVSAEIVSGHPMFIAETKRAAMQARFTPTKLSGVPVKVSGVITYKFSLHQ
jgi:protein TonB